MQLLLLHYNNYFNRIIKKKDTIADYKAADADYKEVSNINFNPGDGVNTSLVLGLGQTGALFESDDEFDYLVAYEVVGNDKVINSRWFILEQDRTRSGQYELTLKRDVLADNYADVINSPIFLEKGFINDVNDPLLYNSESMNVNQIKQLEVPLMDETKSGWVVGYIPSDAFPKIEPEYDRVEKKVTVPMSADYTVNGLSNWSYWKYCSSNPNYKFMSDNTGKRKVTVKIRSERIYADSGASAKCDMITADYTFYPNSNDAGTYSQKNSGSITTSSGTWNYPQWYQDYGPVTFKQGGINSSICGKIFDPVRNNSAFNKALNAILGTDISIGDTSALKRLQDKIILDSSTNTYYKINIISASEENPITVTSSISGGQTALNALKNAMNYLSGMGGTLQGEYTTFTASNSSTSYAIQLTNVGVSFYVDLNSDRAHLNDAPYDMFCIPFSDTLKLKYGTTEFTCSKNVALSMATEIAKDLGSGSVYDVQLLPYCPNRTLVVKSGSPSTVLNLTGVKYDLIKESATNSPKSAVIWCTESTFQVPITTETQVVEFKPTDDAPAKITTETYYYIPSDIWSTSRMAIETTDYNNIMVYKVNKSTNRVIDYSLYNAVEITADHSLKIYTIDNWENPEINMSLQDYDYSDYYFAFWIKNVSYTSQNINQLTAAIRIAQAYSILNPGNEAIERKLANECDVVRLVAQNYSAIFEFSPAKSGGVDGFLADCTYKPFSPYIHILPKLKGLYGDNFVEIDDARGLICGGDMSLSQLSNAWANYQLQNKTYQEMFDRQIKNMDVQNDINKQGALAQLIASPITGGSAGAAAGAQMPGGALGAGVGGAIGAIGGGITAGLDYANSLKMMEENRQYAIDMYGYNLQNIQAIPTSLTKTSALTYNTRVWPFIEYYTCTEDERTALKDKIKYNGMTIMKVSQLRNYLLGQDNFYKGKLIRLNIKVDSHMAYEIYNELNKGVYL